MRNNYAQYSLGIQSRARWPQFALSQYKMAVHDAYYKAVAEEISRRHIDKATWTRAFAESGGNQAVAKSLYCRYRAEQLAAAAGRAKSSAGQTNSGSGLSRKVNAEPLILGDRPLRNAVLPFAL